MSYSKTVEEIQKLPHYRVFTCGKCGEKQRVFTLIIHGECKQCGTKYKFRGVTPIGSEVEDVIDAVLEWIGKEKDFEEAIKWKRIIDSSD